MRLLLDRVITGGLLIAIVVTALTHGAVEPWSIALFELLIATLMFAWAVKVVVERELRLQIPSVALPLAALLIVGLIQSVAVSNAVGERRALSLDIEATRSVLPVIFFLLCALMIGANYFGTPSRLLLLGNFLTFYGLGMAAFALAQQFAWDGRFYWMIPTRGFGFGPFVNRNHFAGYMELLIPIPLALIISGAVKSGRLVYGFAAAMMGTAAIVSGSRGGMLSVLAELILLSVFGKRVARHSSGDQAGGGGLARATLSRVQAGTLAAMAVAIIAGVVWIGAGSVAQRIGRSVDEVMSIGSEAEFSRESIWKDTLAIIGKNPIWGAGLGAYRTAYPIYSRTDGSFIVGYAHNDYLQILADCGIVGGLIALWFIWTVFRDFGRSLKAKDALSRGLALGSGVAVFGMLIHSAVDFNLQIPSNALLFLIVLSVSSGIAARSRSGQPGHSLLRQPEHRAVSLAMGRTE